MFINADSKQTVYILGDGVVAYEYQRYLSNEGITDTRIIAPQDFLTIPANAQCLIGFHNTDYKRRWVKDLEHLNLNWLTYIHPKAEVLGKVGIGSCIGAFAYIGYDSVCGDFTTVCEHSVIGHDTKIGNFCFLGAGTMLGGGSLIGNNVYFGIKSAVRDKVIIENDCFFAIGTIVRKHVTQAGKYFNHGNALHKFR